MGAWALALAGCASTGSERPLPAVPELVETPFFPQTEYACGPAALATILNAAGVDVASDTLVDAVYVEGLKGSLQAELLAATRRYGRLPVPVAPDPRSLLEEIASGRPVLVLQNLGLGVAPRWHYAVVIGHDAGAGRFVLRSGTERRRLERTGRFLRRWRLGEHWGFVAVRPGEIPATATPERYMRALVGAERVLADGAVDIAYEAARERWPESALVMFLSGVEAHTADELATAAALYERTLAVDPNHVAARNNLAEVLLAQGCRAEALRQARAARRREPPGGDFFDAVSATVRRIEAAPHGAPEPASCGPG